MKKCPLCGNEYQDGTTCPSCGILLIDLDTNQAVGTGTEKKEKKFGRKPDKKADKKSEKKAAESQAAPAEPAMDWDYGLPMPEAASKTQEEASKAPEVKPEEAPEEEEFDWKSVEVTAPEDEDESKSFEEQETEEMPVPPVAPTQEMEWDYGLPKPDLSGGGAGGSGGNGTGTSNQRAKKEKRPGSGFTFTITPPMIAIGVAIILLLVAGGFIISHIKAKKEAERYHDSYYAEDYSEPEDTDTEPEPETEPEPDLSDVDINAVEDSFLNVQGTLAKRGSDYMLEMNESANIYIYDADSGENKVVKDVDRLIVDVNYLSADVSEAYGREVILSGYLQMYDSDVVLEAETLEKIRTEEDELAIHDYDVMITDCSWVEAVSEAKDYGGYLVRINSREEYDHILQMLSGYESYHFYLGGARDANAKEYYWIDESYNYLGEPINSSSSWSNGAWFRNEPSFVDTGYDANGQISEDVMNLFCVDGTWYLNDSSNDLIANYSGLLTGKVGYIIEYE